jgi:hypothetical protein
VLHRPFELAGVTVHVDLGAGNLTGLSRPRADSYSIPGSRKARMRSSGSTETRLIWS